MGQQGSIGSIFLGQLQPKLASFMGHGSIGSKCMSQRPIDSIFVDQRSIGSILVGQQGSISCILGGQQGSK